MISRRTWASISMTMAVLFFLFFFTGIMKDTWNNYDVNSYFAEPEISGEEVWQAGNVKEAKIVLIGSKKNPALNNTVRQWCLYTKRSLSFYDSVSDYTLPEEKMPRMILLDSAGLNFRTDVRTIQNWAEKGIDIVFCTLPEPRIFNIYKDLGKLLGVKAVYADKTEIKGVEFFGGFLLGGDVIYQAQNEKEKEQQDFDLEVPWYQTTSGIKTYAVGLMDREKVENEFMPGLIWRNSTNEGKIFAVNGDFLSGTEGLGILSAMVTECSEYDIYPIINAQNMLIANFPGFADENSDKMEEVYSRSQTGIYEDIIWPTLLSIIEKNNSKLTCFLSPQYDYGDTEEPANEELVYQMKMINEVRGEAGLSTSRAGEITAAEKLERDRDYFLSNGSGYKFGAYYAADEDAADAAMLSGTAAAENMTTVVTDYAEGKELFSFLTDEILLQRGTINGFSHTYRENMRMRSLQTGLGYSSILVDFHRILWPQGEEDYFEKLAEKFTSYTNTYWKCFEEFEKTTASESDRRIRQFLALDYDHSREGDVISLEVKNISGDSWFMLRTHDEKIRSVSGGDYGQIENNAYLIHAYGNHLKLKLEASENELYYYYETESGEDEA